MLAGNPNTNIILIVYFAGKVCYTEKKGVLGLEMPDIAAYVIRMLNRAGYDAYLVGGGVRDLLMGIAPHDVDIATAALPEQTAEVFAQYPHFSQGQRFGTVGVLVKGEKIEITTFRVESGYSDFRRPDEVHFVKRLEEDLARRDFTVNSIAMHPDLGVFDPFGGRQDLDARILRTTGDPPERFREDALRILRLFRFAAKLGFNIEAATLDAAGKLNDHLRGISAERVTAELRAILSFDAAAALTQMRQCGIFSQIGFAQEPEDLSPLRLTRDIDLRLALLCIQTRTVPESLFSRLRFSGIQQRRMVWFYRQLALGVPADKTALKRRLQTADSSDFRLLASCFGPDGARIRKELDEIAQHREPYLLEQLAVSGTDLLELGVPPRQIGEVLNQLLCEVQAVPEKNVKKSLLELARCCMDGVSRI